MAPSLGPEPGICTAVRGLVWTRGLLDSAPHPEKVSGPTPPGSSLDLLWMKSRTRF